MTFNIYYKNNEKIVHIYSFIGNEDISLIEELHQKTPYRRESPRSSRAQEADGGGN